MITPERIEAVKAAAVTLYEDEPPAWLLQHFARTLYIAENFHDSGYGRVQRSTVKGEMKILRKHAEGFQTALGGWGGVFTERHGYEIVQQFRELLPKLIENITIAEDQFTKLKPGPEPAAMVDGAISVKEIFALGVWLAARNIGKESRERLLHATCRALWQSSAISRRDLNNLEEWTGAKPIDPGSGLTWTKPLKKVRKIAPFRDENGAICATYFSQPLMMSGADIAGMLICYSLDVNKFPAD